MTSRKSGMWGKKLYLNLCWSVFSKIPCSTSVLSEVNGWGDHTTYHRNGTFVRIREGLLIMMDMMDTYWNCPGQTGTNGQSILRCSEKTECWVKKSLRKVEFNKVKQEFSELWPHLSGPWLSKKVGCEDCFNQGAPWEVGFPLWKMLTGRLKYPCSCHHKVMGIGEPQVPVVSCTIPNSSSASPFLGYS